MGGPLLRARGQHLYTVLIAEWVWGERRQHGSAAPLLSGRICLLFTHPLK